MVNIKKNIAISLKELRTKERPLAKLEQYELDSEAASKFVHNLIMHLKTDELLDAGAGSGSLTLASAIIGIERILALDIDFDALRQLDSNANKLGCKWKIDLVQADFLRFNLSRKFEAIMMNPPFGTKRRHYDRDFLLSAFKLSDNIFSLHKKGNEHFFSNLAMKEGFSLKVISTFKILLKHTMPFHRKPKYYVEVSQLYFKKNG
ncbi:MAG TPA: methyltransferase [Geobacterales bacterium]|nr:methyltransferase [Geobacterales bacterium]